MAGSRMNSVKETLQIFLRSIPEGTLFNIIGFGTNTESLFPQQIRTWTDSVELSSPWTEIQDHGVLAFVLITG